MERINAHVPLPLQTSIQVIHHAANNTADLLDQFYQQAGSFAAVTFVCDQFNEFCLYISAAGCIVVNFLD